MNKKELIEKYEYLNHSYFRRVDTSEVLKDLEQLDEPQKVTVPQFVADVIEGAREKSPELEDALHYTWGNGSKDFSKWYNKKSNRDLFARAWLDGYEVEKEKRYVVKIPVVNQYLVRVKDENFLVFLSSKLRTYFTRKELEDTGFGWVFDCEGVEVEELE
jgi:phage protein